MSATRNHLPGLDALRGLAAIAVLLLHGSYAFHTWVPTVRGYLAVDLFFMLSGFVLEHAYTHRLQEGSGPDAVIKARVLRLYPMMLLGILAGVAASAFAEVPREQVIATALTGSLLAPTLVGDPMAGLFPIDPPLWSLFWEMIASVALARGLWRMCPRRLRHIQVALLAALAFVAAEYGSMEIGFQTNMFAAGALRLGFSFVTGMLLHRWWKRRPSIVAGWSIAWPAGAFAIAICFPAPVPKFLYDLAVVALLFPAIIIVAAGVRRVATPWNVGALASYPLYLIHDPVLRAL